MTVHFQKRDMLNLSLLCPASISHTQATCAHSSSLNDSVNVPHQRMSHSTTLLLWWFLPSVYYIMRARVLLGYIHHNKHTPSALISQWRDPSSSRGKHCFVNLSSHFSYGWFCVCSLKNWDVLTSGWYTRLTSRSYNNMLVSWQHFA